MASKNIDGEGLNLWDTVSSIKVHGNNKRRNRREESQRTTDQIII